MKIWRLYDVTIFDPERIAGERIFPIFPHVPTNKNRNILMTNILRRKINGGQGGIRTLGTGLRYTHFPGVLIRPL